MFAANGGTVKSEHSPTTGDMAALSVAMPHGTRMKPGSVWHTQAGGAGMSPQETDVKQVTVPRFRQNRH